MRFFWPGWRVSMRVGFVTDVEGNVDYFDRYVEASGLLRGTVAAGLDFVDDEALFVYGGDAVDKAPGDIRLCRCLVDLKRRYPNRVWLLVGNRDLNKLRMTAELSRKDVSRSALQVSKPHWDATVPSYAEYVGTSEANRVTRCKWILEHTLGCKETFEHRRTELRLLGSNDSDEAVVESFATEPLHGSLRAYLDNAVVAARVRDTLFVHGSVDRLSAGFAPELGTRFALGRREDPAYPPTKRWHDHVSVDDWVRALNDLLTRGLDEHARRPYWDDDGCSSRGGEALMALQNRCAVWGRSVISNCWADGGNVDSDDAVERRRRSWSRALEEPTAFEASTGYTSDPLDAQVAAWLRADGIKRVVSGHRPTGDSPAVLSDKYHGVELVCADTSYSDTSALDNRGAALACVEVHFDDERGSRLRIHGTLADRRPYVVDTNDDELLGTRGPDGWWYKARLGPRTLLTSRGQGRRVSYRDAEG